MWVPSKKTSPGGDGSEQPPTPPAFEAILSRLSRLEKQNRRLRLVLTTLGMFAAAVPLLGQAAGDPKMIEAERVILTDRSGTRRVTLDGELGEIWLTGRTGARMKLGFDIDQAPQVSLMGLKGGIRIGSGEMLEKQSKGWKHSHRATFPSLEITASNGRPSVILGAYELHSTPEPDARRAGPSGGSVVPITSFLTRGPALAMFDDEGDRSVLVHGISYPSITVEEKWTGGSAALAVVAAEGAGKPGQIRIGVMDGNKRVVWKAP